MIDEIKELTDKHINRIIEVRRHLHQNPELSFKEFNTAKYISKVLTQYNITHKTGIVKTGIVGVIKGLDSQPTKVIALRADLDALPISENTGLSFSSVNDGVMHACGHDVHAASLLGTLIVLNDLKEKFYGSIKFYFSLERKSYQVGLN